MPEYSLLDRIFGQSNNCLPYGTPGVNFGSQEQYAQNNCSFTPPTPLPPLNLAPINSAACVNSFTPSAPLPTYTPPSSSSGLPDFASMPSYSSHKPPY